MGSAYELTPFITGGSARAQGRPKGGEGRPNGTSTGLQFLSCRSGQAHENPPCPLGLDGRAEHRDRMPAYQTTQHWHCPVRKHGRCRNDNASCHCWPPEPLHGLSSEVARNINMTTGFIITALQVVNVHPACCGVLLHAMPLLQACRRHVLCPGTWA